MNEYFTVRPVLKRTQRGPKLQTSIFGASAHTFYGLESLATPEPISSVHKGGPSTHGSRAEGTGVSSDP